MKIRNVFPVYSPKFIEKVSDASNFCWLNEKDFKELKKDKRYDFALTYEEGEIGLAYKDKGKIIALLGASLEGQYFYDIGLKKYVFDSKYKKIASNLLKYFTYEVLINEKGRIPLCSTQFSHSKSINLMVNAGYRYVFTG